MANSNVTKGTSCAGTPRSVVLVSNPNAGHLKNGMQQARNALAWEGLHVVENISLHDLDRLEAHLRQLSDGQRPIIVAAGGDGTIGAVANRVANSDAILGIVPLGTSNDVARSLGIPVAVPDAVHLLLAGKVSSVDLGRFFARGEQPQYFVHAAAMGVDVQFARLATLESWRKRLGHLAYIAAAIVAVRERKPFKCVVHVDGRAIPLCLLHLSVMNAPIFGGRFRFHVADSSVDDRQLDVLAIEDAGLLRIIFGALPLVLGRRPRVGGTRLYHVREMHVDIGEALDLSLDGEIAAHIPGHFAVAPEALQVMTPVSFDDVDDRVDSLKEARASAFGGQVTDYRPPMVC